MNFIISVVLGILLILVISRFKNLRQSFQGEIFCAALFVIEIIQCIISRTIRIYSRSAIFSIIIMIVLPFVILSGYFIMLEIQKTKSKDTSEKEE